MCGIFGFVRSAGQLDLDLLRYLAVQTEERGKHAFGFAWLSASGELRSYKQKGLISAHLHTLDQVADAVAVIGHTRHFTHGTPDNNANNHPHPTGDGFLVHNGVFSQHASFIQRHRLQCVGECDSEALARFLEKHRHEKPWSRLKRLYSSVSGYHSINLAILLPDHLILCRRGNPLNFVRRQTTGDVYFMSDGTGFQPLGLKPTPLAEGEAYIRTISTGRVFKGTLPKASDQSPPFRGNANSIVHSVAPNGVITSQSLAPSSTGSSVGRAHRKDLSSHGLAIASGSANSSSDFWSLDSARLQSTLYFNHPDDAGKSNPRHLILLDPAILTQLANFMGSQTRNEALSAIFAAAQANTKARIDAIALKAHGALWNADGDDDPLNALDDLITTTPASLK